MAFIDYYKILGISKDASDADIKKAYRKLARKNHPDLNPGDAGAKARFQQINEANEVLGDPVKRKKYDQYGEDWKHAEHFEKAGARQQQYQGGDNYGSAGDAFGGDFSEFFESMFGDRKRSSQVKFRGQDFNAELVLDLTEVYSSQQQTITVNGKKIRLTIPAGVENGQTIKITGYGGQGVSGGPNGDLYLTFNINNNTKFKRDGSNLFLTVALDLYTAVLGGPITVDTFDGKVKLTVAPETQNGTRVKLKGKGFPVYKKGDIHGDLHITYQVDLPKNLSEKEKELFVELKKLRDGK